MELACNMDALSERERLVHEAISEMVFEKIDSVIESEMGYQFKFKNEKGIAGLLGSFIEHERKCCPFLNLSIRINSGAEMVLMEVDGDQGVKEFIKTEFKQAFNE